MSSISQLLFPAKLTRDIKYDSQKRAQSEPPAPFFHIRRPSFRPSPVLLAKFKISSALMAAENVLERPLFGGAVSTVFSTRFQDLSMFREVPDHQEAFADPSRDESLIFELLELKSEVEDAGSAAWFLRDLAREQDAQDSIVLEHSSGVEEAVGLGCKNIPTVLTTAIGQMAVSKGRQGREAQNIVRVYLANLRLKGVGTDVLITAYEPILINPLSESAQTVGAGLAVPAVQSGCLSMSDVFQIAVSSFKINDWSLFDSGA